MIVGIQKDLVAGVYDAATGAQVDSGTINCMIRLEHPGDGFHGYYWDTDSSGNWKAKGSVVSWPVATYLGGGQWGFPCPTGAGTGHVDGTIHFTHTDDPTDVAPTTICAGGEHRINAEKPLVTTDLNTILVGADSDTHEDLSDQLDAIAPPAGANQVTIHTQDASLVAIPGAQVSVYDEANTSLQTRGVTDSNGNLVVALDSATYKLRILKSLYAFTVPETIIVTATQTHNIEGTAFVAPTPSDPAYCTVYGTVRDAAGIPVENARVNVYATTPQVVGAIQKGDILAITATDELGYFEVELVRETRVQITVASTGLKFIKTVPDAASQDITTWT